MAKAAKGGWRVTGLAFAIPAGIMARKVLDAAWTAARGDHPPANPASRQTSWPEALAWAALSGVGVGIVRMIAARGAAATWETLTGSLPPGLEDQTV